jgi:hypothetical protein
MKQHNDDSRACSDAKAIKTPPATDLEWMTHSDVADCKIAAGRASLQDLMEALRILRDWPGGGGQRKASVLRAIKHRFGVAPAAAAMEGGNK